MKETWISPRWVPTSGGVPCDGWVGLRNVATGRAWVMKIHAGDEFSTLNLEAATELWRTTSPAVNATKVAEHAATEPRSVPPRP